MHPTTRVSSAESALLAHSHTHWATLPDERMLWEEVLSLTLTPFINGSCQISAAKW